MELNLDFNPDILTKIKEIGLSLLIGYLIIQSLVILVRRVLFKRISKQSKMLISKGIIYAGVVVLVFIIIGILELKSVFTTLLGAAGILGIILGIASQTSIGNIISGIFLISEKPFELGDLIRVGDKSGHVYSIDLLSIKLKTLDNLLIRIPHQTIISTEVTNVTRFPIRRMDIEVGVAYKENINRVIEILKSVARENPLCLVEPEPLVIVRQFGPSSIDILFGVWFEKSNYLKVKNSIFHGITESFANEGIEIPFPHISLYTGEQTKPFPFHNQGHDTLKQPSH
jgi:small-conductance mechanosensitive channel